MNTSHRNIAKYSPLILALGVLIVGTTVPSISLGEGWELRTALKEVPGTREIESGDLKKGIQISKTFLKRVNRKDKVAVLNNLCIGAILIKDFDQAKHYCDLAVESPSDSVLSHNNRGVLEALNGNYLLAQQDFTTAWNTSCIKPCNLADSATLNRSYNVARRNLARIESQILASDQKVDDFRASEKR